MSHFLTIISIYGILPIYGKRQILKLTAVAKKCHRINIKGASSPYEKFKENLNPKPSPCSYLKGAEMIAEIWIAKSPNAQACVRL